MKVNENKIWELRKIYRNIIDHALDGIWIIDVKGNTTYVNDSMAKILGFHKKEMIGKNVLDFTPLEGVSKFRKLFRFNIFQSCKTLSRYREGDS